MNTPLEHHPFLSLGRAASLVIRYKNYERFKAAAAFFQKAIGGPQSSLKDSGPDMDGRYSTPMGANADVELRLVYRKGNGDSKEKAIIYYQVSGTFSNDQEAKAALNKAVGEFISEHTGWKRVGDTEDDGDPRTIGNKRDMDTHRAVLSAGPDDTQVGLLVNPPFPRTGAEVFLQKLPALLAITAGMSALLLGTLSLLRRR